MVKENKSIPIIPVEYIGKYQNSGGYTTTKPRVWTNKEIEWIKNLKEQGYNNKEIAQSIGRSETSVSIKIKRLGKKENTYNKDHIEEKYELNKEFLKTIQPKTILDLYCGTKSYYSNYGAVTNDIDKNIPARYHEEAHKLICKLFYEGNKYDLIDLDPYGSAYDCFDLAIKMAKKGLIITLGELGHKRWKRLDFVSTHYGIKTLEEFTIENLIEKIKEIGLRNKKELEVWNYKEWKNIGRVYFVIKEHKVTSQWESN